MGSSALVSAHGFAHYVVRIPLKHVICGGYLVVVDCNIHKLCIDITFLGTSYYYKVCICSCGPWEYIYEMSQLASNIH